MAKRTSKKGKKAGAHEGLTEKNRKALLALSPAAVHPPPIPVHYLIGEARALEKVTSKYAKELRKVGVDAGILKSLGGRTDLLASAQGDLALVRRTKRSKAEIDLEAQSIEMRRDMIADGRFALRADVDAQAALDHVQEGEGLDDLVQDLHDMSSFHAQYKSALSKIGVNADAKAKKALALARSLGEMLAARRSGDAAEETAFDLRDRASSYLVLAMREVRDAGGYAFRSQPEIAARFRGTYFARHRGGKKKVATPATPPNAAKPQAPQT